MSAPKLFESQVLNSIATSESTPLELMDLVGSMWAAGIDNNADNLLQIPVETTSAASSSVAAAARSP